jgi:hypothetical protein
LYKNDAKGGRGRAHLNSQHSGGRGQEDGEFEANLGYTARHCLKTKQNKTKQNKKMDKYLSKWEVQSSAT